MCFLRNKEEFSNDEYPTQERQKKMNKTRKVPGFWKEVAEYIVRNGGSYHFGNATCKKKWDEVYETAES